MDVDNNTISQLLRPQAFEHVSDHLALRETHISWVILSGEFAYKIKKPVDFGFLDFSTPALRRHYCEQELALNRRFAPELYLEVVTITAGEQGPQVGGTGPVIDHAVRMRRFDEEQLLATIAGRGELDRALVRALAAEFARLHDLMPTCHPAPGSMEPGAPGALRAAMEENFTQVRAYPLTPPALAQLAALEQWWRERYQQLLPHLEQRAAAGHVIDGHGDAHLGNIALVDGRVRLFDCIEFNPAFRIMDSMAEVAFLAMDLDARGHHGESHWLLGDYLEYRGDYDGLAAFDLYRAYFALVRAKVALLRAPPGELPAAESDACADFCRYLQLAGHYCRPGPRFLAITHGVSGSGKSTIADALVAAGGVVRIRSDVERKRLFGLAPEERSQPADEKQLYSVAMSRKTFRRLATLAAQALQAGFAVIVDATFLHRKVRANFRRLAAELGVAYIIIECGAPPQQLRQRLLARERAGRDASEAGVAVMESQLAVDEPLAGPEIAASMAVGPGEDGAAIWQRLLRHLER